MLKTSSFLYRTVFIIAAVILIGCGAAYFVRNRGQSPISAALPPSASSTSSSTPPSAVSNPLGSLISHLPAGSTQLAAVEGAGSGLTSWWKFDDGSGGSASDSAGSNSLTLGGATWASGKTGGALSFNGNDARATAGSDLIGTGDVSVCAWYYASSASNGASLFNNNKFILLVSTSNNFEFTSDGGSGFFAPPNSVTLNNWKHVCVTRDSGGNGIIYINGALAASGSSGTPTGGGQFTVGNHPWVNGQGWNGLVDDVRLYNRVLSGAEVQSIYVGAGGTAAPAPVISGLSLSAVNTTSATIVWTTDVAADSGVDYGTSAGYSNSSPANPNLSTSHSVTLSGLTNGATYHYRASSRNSGGTLAQSADGTFTTAEPGSIDGTTYTAKSCKQVDVQNAVNQATDGMTVVVPSSAKQPDGVCVWTQGVIVDLASNPKSIILKGAGIDQTIIQDNITRVNNTPHIFYVSTTNGKSFRLTGFTFANYPGMGTVSYDGNIVVAGTSKAIRVDNNKFSNLASDSLAFHGYEFGVVDHNIFNSASHVAIQVNDETWPGPQGQVSAWGDGSWASPLTLGDEKAIYIEGNIFTNATPIGVTDGYYGARMVVRFNDIHDDYITQHGSESGRDRGTRSMEIYGNIMNDCYTDPTVPCGLYAQPVYIRSGTGVIFDNKMTGYYPGPGGFKLLSFRDMDSHNPWGTCDGTSPFDQNDGQTYDLGSSTAPANTGTVGDAVLTDTTKNWTASHWVGYSIFNVTQGWSSMIDSNTVHTISSEPSGYQTARSWSPGDSYRILKASRCFDAPGAGTSDLLRGDVPVLAATGQPGWPNQASDPWYAWGNTMTTHYHAFGENIDFDGTMNVFGPKQPNIIPATTVNGAIVGDYVNNSSKPGYQPLACPYPLITTGFTADTNPDTTYCAGVSIPPPNILPVTNNPVTNPITDTTAPSISSILSASITSTGAAISWTTNEAANSKVDYGLTTSYGNSTSVNSSLVTAHSATLSGLTANTVYHYRITSKDSAGNTGTSADQTFTTLAVTGGGNNNTNNNSGNNNTVSPSGGGGGSGGGSSTVPPSSNSSAVTTVNTLAGANTTPVSVKTTPNAAPLAPVTYTLIAKPLTVGASGSQVSLLQNILVKEGFISPQYATGYYGSITESGVAALQAKYGIVSKGTPQTTGLGAVGPKTESLINQLIQSGKYSGTAIPASTNTATVKPTTVVTAPAPTIAAAPSTGPFTKPLGPGSNNADVKRLQIFLNTHGFIVASTGPGSRGNESTYFGPATQKALKAFQNLHASAILVPNGQSFASGYFDTTTMKVVNSLR